MEHSKTYTFICMQALPHVLVCKDHHPAAVTKTYKTRSKYGL